MKRLILFACLFICATCNHLHAGTPEVKVKTAVGYYNRALAEFSYGNGAAAMENVNKALELKPDFADALSYRGYFYKQAGDLDKAIADYLAAEKLSPNVNGYFTAVPFALKGNKDEAFKWLEASLTASVNKAQIAAITADKDLSSLQSDPRWNALITKNWYTSYEQAIMEGNNKLNAKDLAGAVVSFTKAIQLDATKDDAYERRAFAHIYAGNFDKAIADLNAAIFMNPKKSVYYGNRAYCFKELKRYSDAIPDYNKAIELDPTNMVYADRAKVKEMIDLKDKTVGDDFKTYLDAYYKDDVTCYYLATHYYMTGWDMGAQIYIDQAIEANAKEPEYHKMSGKAQIGLKYFTTAIMALNTAISLNQKDGESYYLRGIAKAEKLDKAGACEDFKMAAYYGYKDQNNYLQTICK